MQCYFTGDMFVRPGQPVAAGVVSFQIPDLDITFRAHFRGSPEECQYASLLALLEFVELNTHLFKNRTLELYSDSSMVVKQLNDIDQRMPRELEPFRDMALTYRRKYPFVLHHVRRGDNPAQNGIPHTDA